MPILGWLAGSTIASLISWFDHWVAMGLLTFVVNGLLFYLLALIVPAIMTADSIIAVISPGW